ncbi:MAG TPA: CHAT domain-containing protein, partial [Dongiaceae bacterium]|nr:CHAT domain-containing protein [Dongiaceae bacterium]
DRAVEARLAMAHGDLAAARRHGEAALDLSESARGRATSARVRSAILASGQSVYETLVDVLMAQHDGAPAAGYDARALEVSERARARSMLESMLGQRPSVAGARGAGPVEEMRGLQLRLNAKAEALDGARRSGNTERIAALTHDIDEMSDAFTLLEARVRRAAGPVAAVVTPAPLTSTAIRTQLLDRNTVLVEYLLTDTSGYAWLVTRDRLSSHRLAARKIVEEAAAAYQVAIARPPTAAGDRETALAAAAAKLSELLLSPMRELPAGRRLLIVAPGPLQQIPFAALQVPGSTTRMVERFEIVQAPSASIVAAARKAGATRPRAGRSVAIFADPVFETADARVARAPSAPPAVEQTSLMARALEDMPEHGERAGLGRLVFSRQEAEAIAALAPAGSVRLALGFDASLAAVTDPALADYRVVHFATHGLLDTRTPELSGLVFSLVDPTGSPQAGYLRLHEVDRLHLNADLAVLSGCETALGRSIAGEGIIGLTRSFMLAGARGVVASLWKVDDLATAEMMQRFYRGLLVDRLAPPAALRRAQTEMATSERWRDPWYWAGFVVQGEWR